MAPNPQNIAPNRDVDPPAAATPAQAVGPQVVRLAESARELQRVIRAANGLPPGFPEDEILALADALRDAPDGDPESRLEAAIYVRERFVDCRRRFVTEAPHDPDVPSIDAIAHGLNDTIAELSTLAVTAGREAEVRARPDRAGGTSIIATAVAGPDVIEAQLRAERAVGAAEQVETALRSAPVQIYIGDNRQYNFNFLNFSGWIKQLKLRVKLIGASFKGEFLDRAWLDRFTAGLDKARAGFKKAWDEVKSFLEQFRSIVDAVRRVRQEIADLIVLVRDVTRRVFRHRPAALEPGTIFRDIDAPWCPEMVVIPAGEFVMGSTKAERRWAVDQGAAQDNVNGEQPQHRVKIEKRFAVGVYPVTFDNYDRFADATGRERPGDEGWDRGRRPVINVSWEAAKAYVAWLSNETNQSYRLLSEAEWEYAARAGTTTRHWWGDDISQKNTNYRDSGIRKTTEVGSYPANPWGLYDMNGNVWEWGADCWNRTYDGAPDDGSVWERGNCDLRIIRGGSLNSVPGILRAAYRNRHRFGKQESSIGFRVARMLTP